MSILTYFAPINSLLSRKTPSPQPIDTTQIRWIPKAPEGANRAPVFFYRDVVMRAIHNPHGVFFTELFSSGLMKKLITQQLIPATQISPYTLEGFDLLIEQERLRFTIYPQEWTYAMLQTAAKLVLHVNITCENYGYETNDCHGLNVFFAGSRAQFIDIGSFVKKQSATWVAIDEFIRCYLHPLKLWSQGHSYLAQRILADNHWKRFYPEDTYYRAGFEDLLQGKTDFHHLIKLVDSIEKKTQTSAWQDYHATLKSDDGTTKANRRFQRIIALAKNQNLKSIHDIGGNAGAFTRLLLAETNVETVLCSDRDENAINDFFHYCTENPVFTKKVSCVLLNAMSPINMQNHMTAFKRLECEAVFALALLHHLVLAANTAMDHVLNTLAQYTSKTMFIEFMPYSHLNMQSRIISDNLAHYTESWFAEEFSKLFSIQHAEHLELNRILYIGEKKTAITSITQVQSPSRRLITTPVSIIVDSEQDLILFDKLLDLSWTHLTLHFNKAISREMQTEIKASLQPRCKQLVLHHSPTDTLYHAIDQLFQQFEYGIVLDCGTLPCASFFHFCEDLLKKYADDDTVLQIGGVNLLNYHFESDDSYLFSRTFFGGGFATWRNRWQQFKSWRAQDAVFAQDTSTRLMQYYATHAPRNWRLQWELFGKQQALVAIQPKQTLVQLLQTKSEGRKYYHAHLAKELSFPLQHPSSSEINHAYETIVETDLFNPLLPFTQENIDPKQIAITITSEQTHLQLKAKEKTQVKITVKNCGTTSLATLTPHPVNLSYHWLNTKGKRVIRDGLRTPLLDQEQMNLGGLNIPKNLFLFSGESRDYFIDVEAPEKTQDYILRITMVQEGYCWFTDIEKKMGLDLAVTVRAE